MRRPEEFSVISLEEHKHLLSEAVAKEATRAEALVEAYGRPSPSWRDSDTTKRIEQGRVDAFTAGRNSAKEELDAKLSSQEEALRILAAEFGKKNECFCHAIYNKPCHTCRITAQVTSLLGFWPTDKAKGEII